jgi:hypothetical protein
MNCSILPILPTVDTILELGSFEGGHIFQLAKGGKVRSVLALEGKQYSVDKKIFVK